MTKTLLNPNEPDSCEKCGHKEFRTDLALGSGLYYICERCGWTYHPKGIMDKAIDAGWKKGVKFQFWWLGYLLRNPDLYFIVVLWAISLLFVAGVQRNSSLASTALEWLVGSLFLSIAPVLTLLYIRRKRAGLSLISGWIQVWKTSLRPAGYTVVGVAVFFCAILATRSPA